MTCQRCEDHVADGLTGRNLKEPSPQLAPNETRDSKMDGLTRPGETLTETITQQSNVIDGMRTKLAEVKPQQQVLQTPNGECHGEIRGLQLTSTSP